MLKNKQAQWALLVFIALIWGSSFILMKRGLESYSYTQVAALRVFISFLFLLPLIVRNFHRLNPGNLRSLILVGVVGNGLPALLFTTAQTHIDSAVAGMLNSLVPLFALIVGIVVYKKRTRWMQVIGLIIGLFGAVGMILAGSSPGDFTIDYYAFFVVLATLCYGINANEIGHRLPDLDGVTITALAFLFIGPVAGIYLFTSDFSVAALRPGGFTGLGYIALLALFSTVIAVSLFSILIKHTSPVFGVSVTYLIPGFAIFWGLFDGEAISAIQIACIGIILLGVYLVNGRGVPSRVPAPAPHGR